MVLEWKDIVLRELIPVVLLSLAAIVFMFVVIPLIATCCQCCGESTSWFENLYDTYTCVFKALYPFGTVVVKEKTAVFAERQPETGCAKIWTCLYFAVVLTLASCWGFVVFWNSSYYRKTNTCNDINVDDDSYVCYTTKDYEIVDCMHTEKPGPVLCYLETKSFAAGAGIGFSIFQLMLGVGKVGFTVATWFASKGSYHCGSICFFIISIVVGVVLIAILIAYPVCAFELDHTSYNVFFGHPVLVWWMYALLVITIFLCLPLLIALSCANYEHTSVIVGGLEMNSLSN